MSLSRNIAANYLGRAYSMGAIYFFVPFYIMILGVEAYGLIAFNAVMLTIAALADVGLSTTFSREAARETDKKRLLDLLTAIEVTILLSTGAVALAFLFMSEPIAEYWLNLKDLNRNDTVFNLRLMALTLPFQLIVSLYFAALLGLQKQAKANLIQAVNTTMRSGLVILPIWFKPTLGVFFTWQLCVGIILAVFVRYTTVQEIAKSGWAIGRFAFSKMKPVLNFAGGMFAITIISSINTQLDKIVVSKIFDIAIFSKYTLASSLAQLPYIAITPLMAAIFPKMVEAHAQHKTVQLNIYYENVCLTVSIISSFVASFLFFNSKTVYDLWVGSTLLSDDVYTVTRILTIGGFFLSLAACGYYFCLVFGHMKTSIALGILTLFVTSPLVVILSRYYGIVGAAAPWLILNIITYFSFVLVATRHFYRKSILYFMLTKQILPSIFGSAPIISCSIIGLYMKFNPILEIILILSFSIIYFLLFFVFNRNFINRRINWGS